MTDSLLAILSESTTITGFVFVMMLIIEYVNVQTRGIWQKDLLKHTWKQYLLAGLLGIIPGCLGAFTVVSLFSHRLISFGALVTSMIATSGDEAFVMFALFPKKTLLLTILLLFIGIIAGYLSDRTKISKKIWSKLSHQDFPLHENEDCRCFQKEEIIRSFIKPSSYRLGLLILLLLLLSGLLFGLIGNEAQSWMKITIFFTLGFCLFVVLSVPEHFLKKHLWEHIVVMHLPKIFFWTLGTLLLINLLMNYMNIETWLSENMIWVLILAVLVGIIPESGPHLVFVTLFAQGLIPFSILLAGSISQDGHGMLPLLAESKRGFLLVKFINVIVALLMGFWSYFMGF